MENLFTVKNNTALITGASSGIGRHFATTLAKQGVHVVLVARNEDRLKKTARECEKFGVKTLILATDVKNPTAVEAMATQASAAFPEINILINAAGVGMRVPTLDLTNPEWDEVMDINLKGTFLVTQAIAKHMMANKTAGKILNISSAAAFHTTSTRAAYSASKIGVESITRTFALSLAPHNIRVNCIAPGFFVTELTENYLQTDLGKTELANVPMQRAAHVRELEGVLFLLVSDASSYMTGSVIHIDGGFAVQKV